MSVSLSVRFLAGRYHATPWGRQVNEGAVEWPPSPWRILRALVAAWHKNASPPPRETLAAVVEKLATRLPSYQLPAATEAHTRHYVPLQGLETTKVLDAFVAVGRGARDPGARVRVTWPGLELEPSERDALTVLCDSLTYIGRAESWAEVEVEDQAPSQLHVVPGLEGTGEAVRLLAPVDKAELAGSGPLAGDAKRGRRAKTLHAPTTILEALEVDTGTLQDQAWSGVPGSRWADYRWVSRPEVSSRLAKVVEPPPTMARYALSSTLLPSLTEALSVGERFRKALLKRSDGMAVFAGKDRSGQPLKGHGHARYLVEDADGDGRVDHVVVYAAQGFSPHAVDALESLRRVWGREGFDIDVSLIALGQPEDYGQGRSGDTVGWGLSATLGRARTWRSATPVVLPRHPKKDRRGRPRLDPEHGLQKDGPEHQVRRYLKQLAVPEPVVIEVVSDGKRLGRHPWHAFRRVRLDGGGARSSARAYGFVLRFEQPVTGPIAIGYGSHMGLGIFVPLGDEEGT